MNLRSAVASALVVLAAASWAFAQQGRQPGDLVVVSQPGHVRASVGDLIQLRVNYPVIPDQMIANLQVQIQGDTVRNVVVVQTPELVNGQPLIGSGSLSAFVVAQRPGPATVRVIPQMLQGGQGEPRDYQIQVSQQGPR